MQSSENTLPLGKCADCGNHAAISKDMADALKMVDDNTSLQRELVLRRKLRKLIEVQRKFKWFFVLKARVVEAKFEKHLRELTMTLLANGDLWSKLGEVADRERRAREMLLMRSGKLAIQVETTINISFSGLSSMFIFWEIDK